MTEVTEASSSGAASAVADCTVLTQPPSKLGERAPRYI